jgi:hypothetical protein
MKVDEVLEENRRHRSLGNEPKYILYPVCEILEVRVEVRLKMRGWISGRIKKYEYGLASHYIAERWWCVYEPKHGRSK